MGKPSRSSAHITLAQVDMNMNSGQKAWQQEDHTRSVPEYKLRAEERWSQGRQEEMDIRGEYKDRI